MNRVEYMEELKSRLKILPKDEFDSAIVFYNEYFDDAGVENEEEAINKVGTPKEVADKIIEEYKGTTTNVESDEPRVENTTKATDTNKTLLIVLLIVTCPIWIGIVGGAFGILVAVAATIVSLSVALFATCIAFVFGGLGVIIASFVMTSISGAYVWIGVGTGTLLMGLGLLLSVPTILYTFKAIPAMFRWVVGLFRSLLTKKKGSACA